jgi:hypothetical protein
MEIHIKPACTATSPAMGGALYRSRKAGDKTSGGGVRIFFYFDLF